MAARKKATAPKKPGRKTLRTPAVEKVILDELRKGKPDSVAAAVAGINEATFRGWIRADQEFHDTVARARLLGCSELHDEVKRGDEKGYSFGPAKTALELLSRRFPKHYSTKIQISMESELEKVLDVVERICSREDFERVLAGLAALDSGEEAGEAEGESASIH